MKQYSTRMVIIHWLTLILLVVAYFMGDELDDLRHENAASLNMYLAHALVGFTVLFLTVLRLFFRKIDGTPPPMGNTLMDKVANGVKHGLYTLLFILPLSGIMIVLTSDVSKALMSGDATLLPAKYLGASALPHTVHELLVNMLILVVVVHLLGAVKHQFIMKDGIMERMSLRRKN